ncbi:MAG: hypothetical protein LBF12_00980 [Christensenellaceae bacterium]|jgi:hypothetical protein|nr:hypothetical protein [Christensenellaceae bacterium]
MIEFYPLLLVLIESDDIIDIKLRERMPAKMDYLKENITQNTENEDSKLLENATLKDIPRLPLEWHEELVKDSKWDETDREIVINVETL